MPWTRIQKHSGEKMIINFDTMGGDLITTDKYGYVKGFTIAGADRKFYWAKAIIKDSHVEVFVDQVSARVAVR